MNSAVIHVQSVGETLALGRAIGRSATPGEIVCLTGDLGAGKTHLTQGVGAGLGLPEGSVVSSPTFTLVSEHYGGRLPLYHFDFYRLSDPMELLDLGVDEYFEGNGICIIEWAERAGIVLPPERLSLRIEFGTGPEERAIHAVARGQSSIELLTAIGKWDCG